MPTAPLVTVLLAVHDGESFVRAAVESALRQTVADLEVIVVDDASTDATPELLERLSDPRLRVLRNDERLGLARSLNRGLDEAQGAYVARLDADDVAFPSRIEQQLRTIQARPELAVVGSAVLDLGSDGSLGGVHVMPTTPGAVRFASLFSSPFLHPTVLVSRAVLEEHALRYDEAFAESEDYDLWTRLLAVAEGANLEEPLTVYRVHPGQASHRRRGLQRELQLRVSRRAIAGVAPSSSPMEVERARRVGVAEPVSASEAVAAADAYLAVVAAFERLHGPVARERSARDLGRLAGSARARDRARILAQAARLDPGFAARAVLDRGRRAMLARTTRRKAAPWLSRLAVGGTPPIRVAAVFPEPTPYRAPLLDRIAALPDIDLTVVYAAESLVGRSWHVPTDHRAVFLSGLPLPGGERVVRHDYPVTPGIFRTLSAALPDVAVVSGWSTFAAQGAILWCRARRVPYVLVVESHDEGPRAGWRRAVKSSVVPRIVRGASSVLVTGTLARGSMTTRGADPQRVRVFANTVDVGAFERRAEQLSGRRTETREQLGCDPDDVLVLSVGRLVPEKRYDVLVRAAAEAREDRLSLVLVGDGPERGRLERLSTDLGVRLRLTGDWPWEKVVEAYVAADVFALLSERETWAVVVNEAAACGLPLVLSDRVGAAYDLLRDGENGVLVPAGDVDAASGALRRLAADPELRSAWGARSREIAQDWGYGPSIEGFAAAVREAAASRRL